MSNLKKNFSLKVSLIRKQKQLYVYNYCFAFAKGNMYCKLEAKVWMAYMDPISTLLLEVGLSCKLFYTSCVSLLNRDHLSHGGEI